MDIKAVRTQNLKLAIKIAGGMTQLAEKSDTSTSYLSQCLSDTVTKSLGSKIARRIENALGFDAGWMDTPHEPTSADATESGADFRLILNQLNDKEKDDLNEFVYLMIRKRKITEKYE